MFTKESQAGAVNPLIVSNIIVGVIAISLAGFSVWSYINYIDQRDNVDSKIAVAVEDAKKIQSAEDRAEFAEQEKSPVRTFVGPDDLGRVSFQYPKTWSGYIEKDGSNGQYEAYFNPLIVREKSLENAYALRVTVDNKAYEDILKGYESRVTKGELSSAPLTVNGFDGIRLAGAFDKDRKGTAVIFKVRDKTLTLATDTEVYISDFGNIVLASLTFNP